MPAGLRDLYAEAPRHHYGGSDTSRRDGVAVLALQSWWAWGQSLCPILVVCNPVEISAVMWAHMREGKGLGQGFVILLGNKDNTSRKTLQCGRPSYTSW